MLEMIGPCDSARGREVIVNRKQRNVSEGSAALADRTRLRLSRRTTIHHNAAKHGDTGHRMKLRENTKNSIFSERLKRRR